jgi:hypothetical protein
MTTTRKYAMTRVGTGDYLMPANDAQALWRLARYTEDGSATLDDGTPVLGEFWGVWRWRGTMHDLIDLEWYEWDMWAQGFRTRAEAEREALR